MSSCALVTASDITVMVITILKLLILIVDDITVSFTEALSNLIPTFHWPCVCQSYNSLCPSPDHRCHSAGLLLPGFTCLYQFSSPSGCFIHLYTSILLPSVSFKMFTVRM